MQGSTTKRDKLNDNILFSCCCARVDYAWRFNTVCDCCTSSWECSHTCIESALDNEELYYHIGVVSTTQSASNTFSVLTLATEPIQQPDVPLPRLGNLARRALVGRRYRQLTRRYIRRPDSSIRSTRRTSCRTPIAPSLSTATRHSHKHLPCQSSRGRKSSPDPPPHHPYLSHSGPDPVRRVHGYPFALCQGGLRT